MSSAHKAEIGAGIAAGVAAAAIGAYLLYGSKDAKKNRTKVKGWMLKAKGEILERIENMEEVTETTYQDVIDNVISRYRGAQGVSAAELMALASDARKHWKVLKPMMKKQSGSSARKAKSSPRKKSARKSGASRAGRAGAKRSSGAKSADSSSQ